MISIRLNFTCSSTACTLENIVNLSGQMWNGNGVPRFNGCSYILFIFVTVFQCRRTRIGSLGLVVGTRQTTTINAITDRDSAANKTCALAWRTIATRLKKRTLRLPPSRQRLSLFCFCRNENKILYRLYRLEITEKHIWIKLKTRVLYEQTPDKLNDTSVNFNGKKI